ncbi:fungal specific transcription factor [Fusarium albosuccineum]|uniref:Fungal specific transcription factor n=1 Tax=Fusarium albosuccineum TaxID=1237068 RepID=A0A8H4L1E9_9HYPO|nr:fungal specific transcription factor [Fusarium albosuccineum]
MADQPPVARGPKRGRRITACAQCQKRKKKCDRRWPCNHCRKRNLAHECEYEGKMAPRPEAHVPDQIVQDSSPESTSASAAVTSLGYISDPMFKTITTAAQPDDAIGLPGPALEASRAVPPRPYADILVQNFFDHVNHHYCVLYKPSFQASYELWWSRRRDASSQCTASTIAATSLILRVCANSIQFLPVDAQARLEEDLGETVASLGQRYHTAANTLGDLIPPGLAGLVNSQQLFLGATWLKAEANFVDSWHMLAVSVRQAQEIAVFNRPTIISSGPVPYPSSTLDLSGRSLDAPSAALAKILENQLGRVLSGSDLTNQTLEE